MVERVVATKKAEDLIARLKETYGALLFHQSGGCCDGSSPMCFPEAEFRTGPSDVLLGEIAGCPFYIGAAQFEYRRNLGFPQQGGGVARHTSHLGHHS